MNHLRTASQKGFTLIELVIVVIVLGLLAATAAPRFLEVTEDAEDATVEGVAGGFASSVVLVRAEWELAGRPNDNESANNTTVDIGGVVIGVDSNTGYPTGELVNDSNTEDNSINVADCQSIFTLIMQSAPTITSTFSQSELEENRYFTSVVSASGPGTPASDVCYYYLTQTIKNETSAPNSDQEGNGFFYIPRIGQVTVFSNNSANN